MKKLFTVTLLFLSFSIVNTLAARYTDGYLLKGKDTVKCQILVHDLPFGLDQFRLQRSVIIRNAAGDTTRYLPSQVQGFGFQYGTEQMRFVPNRIKEGTDDIFMRVITQGSKFNLFLYEEYYGIPFPGKPQSPYQFYLLEDEAKRKVSLIRKPLSGINQKMEEYFSERPEMLKLYKEKASTWKQIPDFVQAANAQP